MKARLSAAFHPSYRLIPSRFPPEPLFDTVATVADLELAMELCGWTNDRLVPDRLRRLPKGQWVYGRPNSSIVMASFLHVASAGMRFNGPDLGAWYSGADIRTAAAEVAHHLRREAYATNRSEMKRTFRTYSARLDGDQYHDIRGEKASYPGPYDPTSYAASQAFGEDGRKAGRDGILYDSLRHRGGMNAAAFVPTNILEVTQTDHFEISVSSKDRAIKIRQLRT